MPTGVAAYNKLVNQTPTVAIMGLNNSSFQGAVIENVAEDEIPIVGAESTTQAALNPFNPWFFALQCTYTDQADVAVAYLINKTGIENPTAVALYGDVASGQEWSGLIEERITRPAASSSAASRSPTARPRPMPRLRRSPGSIRT